MAKVTKTSNKAPKTNSPAELAPAVQAPAVQATFSYETIVTAVVHGPAGAPRVTIFGHTASAVLRWAGAQGWTTKLTYECLKQLGLPITLITVRCQMGSGKLGTAGTRGPVAELTTEQAEALVCMYKHVCKQAAEAVAPRVITTA